MTTATRKRHRVTCPVCGYATERAKKEAAEHAMAQHLAYAHDPVHGRCLSCGDEWSERAGEKIVVCPECASLDVQDVTDEVSS